MKKTLLLLFVSLFFSLSYTPGKAQCNENILDAFGGMSAMSMYNTYMVIGMTSDSYVWEKMTAEGSVAIMKEQIVLIQNMNKSLQTSLDAEAFDQADAEFVGEMITCFDYLESQANAFIKFAEDGTTESAEEFQFYRAKAWGKIEELLGLE